MTGCLDPAEPAVARMRPAAAHLPAVVRNRDWAGFARLTARARTRADLLALVALLAQAADPERLAAVTGRQVPLPLREAHAEYERLRLARLPRTAEVLAGERRYQAHRKREQRMAARAA